MLAQNEGIISIKLSQLINIIRATLCKFLIGISIFHFEMQSF